MKRTIFTFNVCLLAVIFGVAGTTCARARGQAAGSNSTQPQAAPELARLSSEVVRLHGEGKYDEALPLAERALELAEQTFGANSRSVADCLANLGALRFGKKEYDKAEPLYRRALTIYEATAGADSAATVAVLNRLFIISLSTGQFGKADELSQRIVVIAEKQHGADDIETARALVSRAELYRVKGDVKKARDVYARILGIAEKSPPESVRLGITQSLVNYLGLLYARGADDAETERINQLLITLRNAAGAAGQPIQGGVLNGKSVYKPTPGYPPLAREGHEQGVVVVQVLVDETGKVIEAKAIGGSSSKALQQASENAARHARFTPTLLSGVPVKVSGTITYNFTLQ